MKVVCGKASQELGAEVAQELGAEILEVEYKTFPDNEQYVKLEKEPKEEVVVVQSTQSDSDLLTLLFLLDALKNVEVTTVIPYFGYARQDKKFKEGESVSARAIAETLDKKMNELITIDVHDKDIGSFFNKTDFVDITAFRELAKEIGDKNNQFVVAPDAGAIDYAETMATELSCEYGYLEKERKSEDNVEIEKKNLDIRDKEVILVDDIVSTGGTMTNAIKLLKKQDPKEIKVAVTHPVFAQNSIQKIYSAGVEEIIATNTLDKSIASVSVAKPISEAIK